MNWLRKTLTPQAPIIQLEPGEALIWQRESRAQTAAFPAVMIGNFVGLALVFFGGGILQSMLSSVLPAQLWFLAIVASALWLAAVVVLFARTVRILHGWGYACSLTNRRVLQHDQKHTLIRQFRWQDIAPPVLTRHPIFRSIATIRLPTSQAFKLTISDPFIFQKVFDFFRGDLRIIALADPDRVMGLILSAQENAATIR